MRSWMRECVSSLQRNLQIFRREFDRTFKELFGGGKGSLELTGEEDTKDILECGIQDHCTAAGKETAEYDAAVRWRKGADCHCTAYLPSRT